MAKSKTSRRFKAFLCAVNDVFASLRTLADWGLRHRFFSLALVGVLFLLSVSAPNRRGEYYFRTGDEVKYLNVLRSKYAGASNVLSAAQTRAAIAEACRFLATSSGGNPSMDTPAARDLLFGTAVMESDLRPRFQDSSGDAIGLFQIEYGTFRDILSRVLKRKNPPLYESVVKRFGGAGGKITFEDMQTNPVLAAIFARLKYAQFKEPIPPAGDFEAQGEYYKRFYNTDFGLGRIGVFVPSAKNLKNRILSDNRGDFFGGVIGCGRLNLKLKRRKKCLSRAALFDCIARYGKNRINILRNSFGGVLRERLLRAVCRAFYRATARAGKAA